MERHPAELYRVLSRRFPRAAHDDVVDAVREAIAVGYLADIRQQGTVRNVEAFTTTVARRALSRELRRQRRLLRPDTDEHVHWDDIDGRSSEQCHEEHATTAAIDARDIMRVMPSQYAQVMRLHYLEGLTLDEAAKSLGVSAECMRKRHERAIKWARRRFGQAR